MIKKTVILAVLLLAVFAGADAAKPAARKNRKPKTPSKNVVVKSQAVKSPTKSSTVMSESANPVFDIKTSLGDIRVMLFEDTPKHRDNFRKLANEGFYDGVLFHRVIKDFMVQTGDPKSREASKDEMLGGGDPGYTIEAEINYPKHYHKYGALAAARTGDQVNPERRSSGSQFYIVTGTKQDPSRMEMIAERATDEARQSYFRNLVNERQADVQRLQQAGDKDGLEALRQELIKKTMDNVPTVTISDKMKEDYTTLGGAPHLDGQYTVFGEVLSGMDVVEKIQNAQTGPADRPVEDIRIISVKEVK